MSLMDLSGTSICISQNGSLLFGMVFKPERKKIMSEVACFKASTPRSQVCPHQSPGSGSFGVSDLRSLRMERIPERARPKPRNKHKATNKNENQQGPCASVFWPRLTQERLCRAENRHIQGSATEVQTSRGSLTQHGQWVPKLLPRILPQGAFR